MSGDDAAADHDDETCYDDDDRADDGACDNDDDRSDDIDIVHYHDDCGDDCPGKLLEHVFDNLSTNELHVYLDNHDIVVHVNDDVIHYVNDVHHLDHVNDGPAASGRVPDS